MTSDFVTVTELIAVLTVYCAVFCPILCWAIAGKAPVTLPSSNTYPRLK